MTGNHRPDPANDNYGFAEINQEGYVDPPKDQRGYLALWTAISVSGAICGYYILRAILGEALSPGNTLAVIGGLAALKSLFAGRIMTWGAKTTDRRNQRWPIGLSMAGAGMACFYLAFDLTVNGWFLVAGSLLAFIAVLATLLSNADEFLPIPWMAGAMIAQIAAIFLILG